MVRKLPLLAILLLTCTGCYPQTATLPGVGIPARSPDGELRRLSDEEKAIIRRSVLVETPDPAFAEFRWTRFSKSPAQTEYYCGQLNAQTAPGRWVGFRPFVVTVETANGDIRSARLVELSQDRLDVAGVVSKCRENGLDAFATIEGDGKSVQNVK
ncbi:hypothetical protein [Pseudorhodoplanes sinuspersici]|uniref:Uncharacterized protein n=1 Tax=Pseudorhodoplanes sinuspersici TaxID=1235591 RepID=A0A1W6ZV55_9HYPH|nr:hypothetical protein [Pseudorhodoplanes sinuspersici]ARQ01200.1 hypothetical protein CAK95_20440 [Pseudorhodoplanes sinuspersici]RKE72862.1 hypothetical protein DFP91_0735 [Pseudorhodoplanes sinuspersici]